MREAAAIALLVGGTAAGFVVGANVGRAKKPEAQPREEAVKAEPKKPESDRIRVLLASLERSRLALAEKDEKIAELEAELVRALPKALPPRTPEEDKLKRQSEARERWRSQREKSSELRVKILQRKDKALRAQGVAPHSREGRLQTVYWGPAWREEQLLARPSFLRCVDKPEQQS